MRLWRTDGQRYALRRYDTAQLESVQLRARSLQETVVAGDGTRDMM